MDHTNSAIFQRNYLSRMIRYDTQAAYGGTAPRTELIQAANRMSRRIDPRRPKELTEAQSASIRQEEDIQELRGRRDELFQRIRHQFTFIYRAEGQAIYDQYEETKRAVDRKIYGGHTPGGTYLDTCVEASAWGHAPFKKGGNCHEQVVT